MIPNKEIRIGNLFNVDNGLMMRMRVERFFVDEQDRDSVILGSTTEFLQRKCSAPVELLEGIPITEQMLNDLGFQWDLVTATYNYDGIGVIDNGEQGYYAILTPQDYLLTVPLPYLHTLQNLYFYVRGVELPVKVAHFDI